MRKDRREGERKKTKVHVKDTDQCFRKEGGGREKKGADEKGS